MKRVIISGATGAIGTALIRELISKNVEVLVLCREGSKRNYRIPNTYLVKKIFCSMDELKQLENQLGKGYDVFYHFAWEGTAGQLRNNMYMQNRNVEFALDAVEVAKRFGCHTFIGAGSQAEYGRVEGVLKPSTPTFPETGYGMAKLCAGQMTREHAHQIGLNHIWVRILSVYGPDDGEQSMVMSTISKLLNGETPQFTMGEQKWDYVYSGDAAKAFYLLGENGKDGKTYILGSGQARPLVEYIKEIRDTTQPRAQLAIGAIPYAKNQVMFLQADVSDLEKDINWKPQMTFCEGIKEILKINYNGGATT